jgi:glycogen debranching enzyme
LCVIVAPSPYKARNGRKRDHGLRKTFRRGHAPQFTRRPLARAADQFLVKRGAESTVIAGYHWFTDWGRDTLIALPGLSMVRGR